MIKRGAITAFWLTIPLITACGYFSIRHFIVPTENMSPNINPGDHLACSGFKSNDVDPIRRFDIVAFHRKSVPSRKIDACTLFVQRVIGMPGEIVEIRQGVVYIDGKELEQSSFQRIESSDDRKAIKVPENSYYLLGDNRPDSEDSRYIGAIGRAEIECQVGTVISKVDYDNGRRW